MAVILLVDDDPQFRRTLRVALFSNGYDVYEAADGSAALKAATASPPDVVLLDWHLPELNGPKTCKALRANSRVPIIMMSANRSHSRESALEAGANDFLMKPFSFLDLLGRIEAALKPAVP